MLDSKSQYSQPICYTSYGGYRRFCLSWFNELSRWVLGLSFGNAYGYAYNEKMHLRWGLPGWCCDIYTFWHRGHYGWAPSDTCSLNIYLNDVLAGSLESLAYDSHGVPAGYGFEPLKPPEGVLTTSKQAVVGMTNDEATTDVDRRFKLWQDKLLEWAKAFFEDPQETAIYDAPHYERHKAEKDRRRLNLHKALKEIEPWWEALWD